MNIRNILESKDSLQELVSKSMPINTAIKVSKIQKELNEILEVYDSRRKGLFDKYGEPDEDGVKIKEENVPKYEEEISSILDEDLEFIVEKISIDSLGSIEIAPAHLTNLEWLLA